MDLAVSQVAVSQVANQTNIGIEWHFVAEVVVMFPGNHKR